MIYVKLITMERSARAGFPFLPGAAFLWSGAGFLIYGICQWAILALLSRHTGVAGFGEYSLALAIVTPIALLTGLQLRVVQGTDARGSFQFADYLGLRAIATALALAAVCVCAWGVGARRGIATLIFMVGAAKCVETVSDLFQGVLLQHDRHDLVGKSLVLRGVLAVGGFAAGILSTGSMVAGAAGTLAGCVLCLAAIDIPFARSTGDVPMKFRFDRLRELIRLTAPLGIVTGFAVLNQAIPRYFLEHWQGATAVGFFSAAYAIQSGLSLVTTAFAQSRVPALSRAAQSGDRSAFTRSFGRDLGVIAIFGLGGLGAALGAGRVGLRVAFGAAYEGQNELLVGMMLVGAIGYIGIGLWYGLMAMRQFDSQVGIQLTTTLVTFGACAWLVPSLGNSGAVIALACSAVVNCCVSAWILFRGPLPVKRFVDVLGSCAALVVFSPVIAITAVVVRWRLGSPVLFRQQRAGKDGALFSLLKFRTMIDGPFPDAERLTALGRFLRKYSLDEFPQFLNVIRGEMSLVGPRPLLPQYLARYSAEQMRRHEVKPGITGLTQISGRNALDWESKFKLDVWYVDHASLWLDLRLLVQTAWIVISARGISAEGNATAPEFLGNLSRNSCE